MDTTDPMATAAIDLVEATAARPPMAGTCRVLMLDGRSGAGKTTLAGAVGRTLTASGREWTGLALDEVYPGWDGLAAGSRIVAAALTAWQRGGSARWPGWDWAHSRPGAVRLVPPAPFVVIEGVGAGASVCRAGTTLLAWVQAPEDLRRSRALARDGEGYRPHWQRWAAQEEEYLRRDDPRPRCDVVVQAAQAVSVGEGQKLGHRR